MAMGYAGFILGATGCSFGSKNNFDLAPANPNKPPGGGGNGNGDQLNEQNLNGKTLSEVLAVKYTRAELVCSLWSMLASDLDLSRNPNSTYRFNLKAQTFLPFTIILRSAVRGVGQDQFRELHQTDVRLTIYKINLVPQVTVSHDQTGLIYDLLYTPAVGFSIDAVARTNTHDGPIVDRYSNPENTLYEKIHWPVVQLESFAIPNNFNYKTYDYASCRLETDIKPEYAHHFTARQLNP